MFLGIVHVKLQSSQYLTMLEHGLDTYHSKYDENEDVDGDEAMATIWERDRYSMHETVTTSTGEHTGQPGNS